MAACGWSQDNHTQPTEENCDLYRVEQLQLFWGMFIFCVFPVWTGPGVEHRQPTTLNPGANMEEPCHLYKWCKKHKLTIPWLQQASQLLSLTEDKKGGWFCSYWPLLYCTERAGVPMSAWELSQLIPPQLRSVCFAHFAIASESRHKDGSLWVPLTFAFHSNARTLFELLFYMLL